MLRGLLKMFEHCYFITGSNQEIIIVVPEQLPSADVMNLSVTPEQIAFAADYEVIAKVPYNDRDIYRRLSEHTQVGMISFKEKNDEPLPQEITHVAYVEVWGERA